MLLLPGIGKIQLASAQAAEITQLVLDIEKLTQLKQILKDMKSGYDIVSKGYGTIKELSKGNFDLHHAFLSGLLVVNPKLRNYSRVADIITAQAEILKEYQSAFHSFKASGRFSAAEIAYLSDVYGNLLDRSLQNLDALTMVLTDSGLRMSDDERLEAIDHIYDDMQDKLVFLRDFNQKVFSLTRQREKVFQNTSDLNKVYDLKN